MLLKYIDTDFFVLQNNEPHFIFLSIADLDKEQLFSTPIQSESKERGKMCKIYVDLLMNC